MRLLLLAALLLGLAPSALAQGVGVTAAVNQEAQGTPPNRAIRTLALGDNVVSDERITTNDAGLLQILLADGTAFTVGPRSALTIDRFVYDPDQNTAEVSATLTKGVFRFIGGRTSKTENGVRLNSRVGTIGIRGAVVDIATESSGRTSISMIFGREVTLTGADGQVTRIYEPGYSITVEKGADGRERRSVGKTPKDTAGQIQAALAGRPGTTGGTADPPTDRTVADSEVARDNSQLSPAVNNPPVPQPRPQPAGEVQTAVREAGFDIVQNDAQETAVQRLEEGLPPTSVPDPQPGPDPVSQPGPDPVTEPGTVPNPSPNPDPGPAPDPDPDPRPNPTPDPTPNPEPVPDPGTGPGTNPGPGPGTGPGPAPDPEPEPDPDPPTTLPVRLLTAGATYTTNAGSSVSNPGAVGLVGGSATEDRLVTLRIPAGESVGSGPSNRGELVLPVYPGDPDSERFSVEPIIDGASLGNASLSGYAYVGGRDFTAYQLGLNGGFDQPVYALTGTPVADMGVFRNGDVRTYDFSRDLIQNVPVPFFSAGALDADFAGASIGRISVVETAAGQANASPSLFQSWLLIDGEGAAQQSGTGVNVSNVFTDADSGALVAAFGRRGGYRASGTQSSFQSGGTIQTLAAPGGGNEFFGANGQYAVLTGDFEANDFLSDSSATASAPAVRFSTFHVIDLAGEVPTAQGPTLGFGVTKPATLSGFAAGTVELAPGSVAAVPGGGSGGAFSFASGAYPENFSLAFENASRRLGGELRVYNDEAQATLRVPFGDGIDGNANGGSSSYVDDDLFGARENGSRGRTYLAIYDPESETETRYTENRDTNARTYFVSGDANPQPNFLPGGRMCACEFLEWGWWGTQVRGTSDATNAPNREDVRAGVHLGTWVAGDIATSAAVAAETGTASFSGTALGSVVSKAGGATENYLANGAMSMRYDFAAGRGSMDITGFDGRDFTGVVRPDASGGPQALFGGGLTQTNGGDARGAVNGAFVNDGARVAAGVIGNFDLSSATAAPDGTSSWSASGIVAGARAP